MSAAVAAAGPDTRAVARMSAAAPATTAATSEDVTAAADVGIGTKTVVKAVATTAAALRKCSKVN